ncbi:capsid [uncultured virus]|uniref:Capsid n=1 Tax=uncultured virus TaxID=340016 RepID=A0A2K9LUH5_9VIRU|nr:capsid [uncultured virus]
MPYARRRTYGYRPRRRRYTRSSNYRQTTRIVRREITREVRKTHPLQWCDILFDGGNVNTTPTMHSLVKNVLDNEIAAESWREWTKHSHSSDTPNALYQAKYMVSYCHYQLRFQQDVENIESSNTFRTLFYSYIDTLAENPAPLLDGTDIDSPPHTEYVKSMYFDRMRTLRAGTFESTAGVDEPEPTPGTAIIKGNKRLNNQFVFTYSDTANTSRVESGDIRWEAQSDSVGNGLQLYGFIRVYYRRMQ